jgi:monoamine oxidase
MDTDVVVLGGGFAGLIAARDLAERGTRVVVLEARPRLGGRTWYRRFDGTEAHVEVGGAWFSRELQPTLGAEIARYDAEVTTGSTPDLAVWLADGSVRSGTDVRAQQHAALTMFRPALEDGAARIRAWLGGAGDMPSDLDVSAEAWIEAVDAPRAGKDFMLACAALMGGAHPREQSILTLLEDSSTTGYALEDPFAQIGEMLTHGTTALIEAIAADARANGAAIRLGTPVTRVRQGLEGVSVDLEGGGRVEAATGVVALPLNVLDSVRFEPPITGSLGRAAHERHPGVAVKVWSLVDGLPEGFRGVAWPASLIGIFADRSLEGGTLAVGFGLSGGIDAHIDSVAAAIRPLAPDATVRAVDAHDWVNDPWSGGAWMAWRPGWSTGLIDDLERPQGRLSFCGSDLSRESAGWIEGAVSSAHRAAATAGSMLASSS